MPTEPEQPIAAVPEGEAICGGCREATPSLKHYQFPWIVFLIVTYTFHTDAVAFCPRCLRSYMRRWAWVSLLTTNILWPLIVLPLWITRTIASYLHGPVQAQRSWWKKALGSVAIVVTAISTLVTAVLALICVVGLFSPKFVGSGELVAPLLVAAGAMLVSVALAVVADV